MSDNFNSICLAAVGSGSGKTTISLALMRAFLLRGLAVQPFKCGPDYIDPAFHALAARRNSRNLDCWMMGEVGVKESFSRASADADCAVIEGVMGLFDGAEPGKLTGSTAEVAIVTGSPVVLIIDCRGMAGSIAAVVKGCCEFNPQLRVIGVIANKTGSERHAQILRESLSCAGLPPLLGHFPRDERWIMPERHLGLVPCEENRLPESWFEGLAAAAEEHCDLDQLLRLSLIPRPEQPDKIPVSSGARLAVARDEAFSFYYEDNLELLRSAGLDLVEFSPLRDQALPDNINAVYLGGGFPEMFAADLSANTAMRESIRNFGENDGIILAECGGFMYLAESLTDVDGRTYSMCGLVPGQAVMTGRLHTLGYREAVVVADGLFGEAGTLWRGHEFHWSEMRMPDATSPLWRCRGTGGGEWHDSGYRRKNIYAGYIHLHFSSNPEMAVRLAKAIIATVSCKNVV